VGRAPLVRWEALVVCMKDIYFEMNMGARQNIYLGRHFTWLKYFTYHILLISVLAPNYKQYILSQSEVRSVRELYDKSVYLNLLLHVSLDTRQYLRITMLTDIAT
jgi:hypothetical protein